MITCPKCGKQNRREAKFCRYCRADLSPTRAMPSAVSDGGNGLVQAAKRWVAGTEPPPSPRPTPPPATTRPLPASETPTIPRPVSPPQPRPPAATRIIGRLTPLQRGTILSHPRDPRRRYSIVVARELPHSIYYDALNLTCPACRSPQSNVPLNGLCQQCQSPLPPVLIHERRPRSNEHLAEADVGQLIHLSAGHPNILPHQAIVQYQEIVYTVTEHPGRWGVLVRGRQQRSPDEALAGAVQAGQALAYLHNHGFAHSEVGSASIESLIVSGGERNIKLADLSACAPLSSSDARALRAQINRDVAFLGNLLFYLVTGKELSRTSVELTPPALRPFIERAMKGQYASVGDMLTDFTLLPATLTPARSLKPSHGQATHPGQKHTRNEDAVVTFTFDKEQDGHSVPIGFYLVADGMGGARRW